MKVAVLDDYFDTVRGLPSFSKLEGHEVAVWHDHVQDLDALTARLADTEALVLIRERTQIRAPLLERPPRLRLISQRSVYPHIDIDACTRLGVTVCRAQHEGTPSYATVEHTWALMLAAMRQIPQQVASLRAGAWQMGAGHSLRGRRCGCTATGASAVGEIGRAFGMEVLLAAVGERGLARSRGGRRVARRVESGVVLRDE